MRHLQRSCVTSIVALVVALLAAPTARSEMMKFRADLTGQSEVPANPEKGTGKGEFQFDSTTKQLTWTITYAGLTGPATAAHIHGAAAVGANAPPIIPFANPASPISGSATLTDEQVNSLTSGMLYVNVHTAAHRPGEIRGQIVK